MGGVDDYDWRWWNEISDSQLELDNIKDQGWQTRRY